MGRKCCVPFCQSRNESNPRQKISTFTAPQDEILLKKWDDAIERNDRELTTRDVICEKHFNPDCIIKEWKHGDCVIPLKHPRLRNDAIPCIFPNRPMEDDSKRKLPIILKRPKPEQNIISSESDTENSNNANSDNISTSLLENNSVLKPKLVCLNITKDCLTISPLRDKNSVPEVETVPAENITNQEIIEAPVSRSQEQESTSDIVEQVTPFFDFIWNSPLKLSSDAWSLVKVTSKEKYISIGKYILNDQGIPYPERQVLLNEDLAIKFVINGRVLQKHIFLTVIQSLQQLEEAIFNIDSLQICAGGPNVKKYPPDLYSNATNHVDTFLNVWRHNECTLIIPNNKYSTNCNQCKTLSTLFIAQPKTLRAKSDRQENKNKDHLIRRLKMKVNMLKKRLEKTHQLKSTAYNSTDDDELGKLEPKNKILEEEKMIVEIEKPITKNSPTAKELKDKRLRDKIDKWKELEWRDEFELENDGDDDDDDDDDDEMDLERSPQIISTMEDAHDKGDIEGISDDEDESISESELSADKNFEKSVLNSHRLLLVEYL